MIINIPSAGGLKDSARRLHYSAWEKLAEIKNDFDIDFEPGVDWTNEWAEYLDASRNDLQLLCFTIAQANEIGLRAAIAGVSPFLLLIGSDYKFSTTPKDVDFSKFRTIDAVDLPGAVNSICPAPVSDKYRTAYDEVRVVRNAVTHMGESHLPVTIEQIIGFLVIQHETLWRNQLWLSGLVEYASKRRHSFFDDGKYFSSHAHAMTNWAIVKDMLPKACFKRLLGRAKSARRYLCHECFEEASMRAFDFRPSECGTAYLDDKSGSVECLMCGSTFKIKRGDCSEKGCKGSVFSEPDGLCHTCGEGTIK